MAIVRINDLPEAVSPAPTQNVAIDGAETERVTIQALVDLVAPVATEAEAIAGTNNTARMTPLRTKQSIASEVGVTIASSAQGDKADSALQPTDVGSAAYAETADFATAEQGAKADYVADLIATLTPPMLTIAQAEANAPPINPTYYDVVYRDTSYTPNSGGRYSKRDVEPAHPLKFRNANDAWYELDEGEVWASVAGAIGDGTEDDTTALAALASYFIARGGGELHLMPGATYLADRWDLSSASYLDVYDHGASFLERTGTTGDTAFLVLGTKVTFDHFEYLLPAGLRRNRVLVLTGAGAEVRSHNIVSVDQQNNKGDIYRAAVIMQGWMQVLGDGVVTNFDLAYRYNCSDSTIGRVKAVSYDRAHWMEAPTRCSFDALVARVGSPNNISSAGENAVLWSNASDIIVNSIDGEDMGEHGVRFAGDVTGNSDITIGSIRVHNPGHSSGTDHGGSGVKFRTGNNSIRNKRITIGSIIVSDAGAEGWYQPNTEGLLIERTDDLYIGFYHVFKLNQTKSCRAGIVINSSNRVRINDFLIEDTNAAAVILENTDDNGVNFRQLNDIYLKGAIRSIGTYGLVMDRGGTTFRQISVEFTSAKSIVSDGFILYNTGGTGVFADQIYLKAKFNTVGGLPVNGDGATGANPNLKIEYSLDNVPYFYAPSTSTGSIVQGFRSNVGAVNSLVCYIQNNGNLANVTGSYGTISTRRIKSDIVDASDQWDDVKRLKVRSYKNLLTGGRQIGLVAEEVAEVSPGLVEEIDAESAPAILAAAYPDASADEISEMLAEPLFGVKLSVLNLKMLQVVQQLQERVEELENSRRKKAVRH